MITETFQIVSRNIDIYDINSYSGSCEREDWSRGEGIFREGCKCHPDRKKRLVAVIENGDKWDYFTTVSKKGREIA